MEHVLAHRGRLAPSPTGFLHLGNAWSFLWAWLWAKSSYQPQGEIYLRMEDIDPQRSRTEYANAIEHDLRWLGLQWDGEVLYQSSRLAAYEKALHHLETQKTLYPCYCTRKELRTLAGAPHVDDSGAPYPGICAGLTLEERAQKEALGRRASLRLRCAAYGEQESHVHDVLRGVSIYTLQDIGGDFALRRSDGVPAYQLAVVVDDAAQGITHVLRGMDIMISTPRQMLLQRLLGYVRPTYAHVPLLIDTVGERLAKRHDSLSLQALRAAGVSSERIIGLLAHLAGFAQGSPLRPVYLEELRSNFTFASVPQLSKAQDVVVNDAHIRFLYGQCG